MYPTGKSKKVRIDIPVNMHCQSPYINYAYVCSLEQDLFLTSGMSLWNRSSTGRPDWTCIVVGFTSGYVRFYTEVCFSAWQAHKVINCNKHFYKITISVVADFCLPPPKKKKKGQYRTILFTLTILSLLEWSTASCTASKWRSCPAA